MGPEPRGDSSILRGITHRCVNFPNKDRAVATRTASERCRLRGSAAIGLHRRWLASLLTLVALTIWSGSVGAQVCGTFEQIPTPNPGTTGNNRLCHTKIVCQRTDMQAAGTAEPLRLSGGLMLNLGGFL